MKPTTHIDCFSGAGGFCTGMKAAGVRTVGAIEKVSSCVVTYRANHSEVPVLNKDIRRVTRSDLHAIGAKQVDIVTAGMPCETFSTAGSSSRSFYDDRQTLYREAIRIADLVKAKLVLLENVPAITTKRVQKNSQRLVVDDIFDALSRAGFKYYIDTILNSVDFGVPQNRERFFILASRAKMELRPPISTRNGRASVGEAFAGLPPAKANDGNHRGNYLGPETRYTHLLKDTQFWRAEGWRGELTYHTPPNHREGTLKRFSLIRPGEGLRDLFLKLGPRRVRALQEQRILPRKWFIQRNRRLRAEEPSVTVTSHCLDELLHPKENRALTVREVARLQSFPDWYDFKGGPLICPHIYETQDKYEQIGDAVPPLVAYHWGLVIREILSTNHAR